LPEFFGDSVHIKGSNRFKKVDNFRHLQLTALDSEISLPLFVWSDDPKTAKTALAQFAFHSDDRSLFIAGLKSQAGNNQSVF
jgi:hypothetical protein